MARGSGVNAAHKDARTARAVACGPYRSNVRLKFEAGAAAELHPAYAGMNIVLGRSAVLAGWFTAGAIGLAFRAELIAIRAATIAKSRAFVKPLTTMLDAMLWFRLDQGPISAPSGRATAVFCTQAESSCNLSMLMLRSQVLATLFLHSSHARSRCCHFFGYSDSYSLLHSLQLKVKAGSPPSQRYSRREASRDGPQRP